MALVRSASLAALGDLLELALGLAQPVDRRLELGERRDQLLVQRVLRGVLLRRRGKARVLDHAELGRLRLAVGREIDAVGAGHHGRSRRVVGIGRERLGPRRRQRVVELGRTGIFQVPDEAIEAALGAGLAVRRRILVVAREARDLAASAVAEGERYRLLGLFSQPVVDDRAVGRVLADVEMLAHADAAFLVDHDGAAIDAEGGTIGDAGADVGAGAPMQLGADRRARREELVASRSLGKSAQPRHVVQDPERAAVRGRHQVGVLQLQVIDRDDREAAAHARPVSAVVGREEHASLRADIEQPLGHGIGADDAGDLVLRQIAVDRLPALAAIAALEQVGLVVGKLVARRGNVDRLRVVRRQLDTADIGELGHALGRDVRPLLAVVARDMDQAVVGRGPDLALLVRRFDDAGAGRVDLGAGALARDVAAGVLLARAVVEAEIGRDLLPVHAFVAGAEHAIAADIDRAGIVRREHDGEGPGEAVLQVLGRDARRFLGPHVDELDLARAMVVALQRAGAARTRADGADIDDVVIARIDGNEARFAGAGIGAVGQRDDAPFRGARHRDRGVVLLGAVDPVGVLVVDIEAVELRGLLVVDRRPGSA